MSMHQDQVPVASSKAAERLMVAIIVVAGTLCVGMITAYITMFDGHGILH